MFYPTFVGLTNMALTSGSSIRNTPVLIWWRHLSGWIRSSDQMVRALTDSGTQSANQRFMITNKPHLLKE